MTDVDVTRLRVEFKGIRASALLARSLHSVAIIRMDGMRLKEDRV